MKKFLLLFLSLNLTSNSMEEIFFDFEGMNRSYLIYIPKKINLNVSNNLIIGLHGYTGTASGFEKETTGGLNSIAEKYGFIAVYPQGLYFNSNQNDFPFVSSWNDLVGSKNSTKSGEICAVDADIYPKYENCKNNGRCSWTSCNDDVGFIKTILKRVNNAFNLNDVYLIGMSNGGMMAQAMACKHPELFKAVINIVGMQHKGGSCIPKLPVNFIIYGGNNDRVVPPVTIKSDDGYFYEPIDKTFSNWAARFNCSNIKEEEYIYFDKFFQKTASKCDENIKIYSILNMNRGHLWPGMTSSGGYCRTESQTDIYYPGCVDIENPWGNDFLFKILMDL